MRRKRSKIRTESRTAIWRFLKDGNGFAERFKQPGLENWTAGKSGKVWESGDQWKSSRFGTPTRQHTDSLSSWFGLVKRSPKTRSKMVHYWSWRKWDIDSLSYEFGVVKSSPKASIQTGGEAAGCRSAALGGEAIAHSIKQSLFHLWWGFEVAFAEYLWNNILNGKLLTWWVWLSILYL